MIYDQSNSPRTDFFEAGTLEGTALVSLYGT
jgi:hypothetical protein